MNKTVTFNLNGLVFTIEEDGYEALHTYLEAVQHYLDKLEEGREILVEVEARIAEKFKNALGADRLILFLTDVEQMKAEMGSPEQFQDTETEEELFETTAEQATPQDAAQKNLFRSKQNRLLGGVASGLAAHLQVDVVVVRLLFILSVFLFAGYGLVIYLILWVAVPVNTQLLLTQTAGSSQAERSKRMYRNRNNKVLAGVSSGLAAYLRIDPVIVRVLFIIALFWGGFGLIAYLVLWISIPEAKTLAQKIEMEGDKPNLANLSKAGQRKQAETPDQSLLNRLLSFPFEVLRVLFEVFKTGIKAFFGMARVFIGAFVLFVSAVFLFSFGIGTGTAFGVYYGAIPAKIPFPIEGLSGSVDSDVAILFLVALFLLIPILFGLFTGIRILFNRSIFSRRLLIVGAFSWAILSVILVLMGVRTATFFQDEGSFTHMHEPKVVEKGMLFIDRNIDETDGFQSAKLRIYPQKETGIRLFERMESRGKDSEEATAWASMAAYGYKQPTDTSLLFNRKLQLYPGARFRGQEGRFDLYVQEGRLLRLSRGVVFMLDRTHSQADLIRSNQDFYIVKVTQNGLECMDCLPQEEGLKEAGSEQDEEESKQLKGEAAEELPTSAT